MDVWTRRLIHPEEDDSLRCCIGEGSFSRVYLISTDGERVVAKWYTGQLKDPSIAVCFLRELHALSTVHHCNIIRCLGFGIAKGRAVLFLECMAGGDLFDWILDREPLEPACQHVIRQLVAAICAIHDANIMHRDLKCENILLQENKPSPRIKLADFGLSKHLLEGKPMSREQCGSIYYAAPEILSLREYDKSADIWSLGIITYVVLTRYYPFDDEKENTARIAKKILTGAFRWEPSNLTSDLARVFVQRCLQQDQDARPTANELTHDPWLKTRTQGQLEYRKKNYKKLVQYQLPGEDKKQKKKKNYRRTISVES